MLKSLATLLLVALIAGPSWAQCPPPGDASGLDAGEIGLFVDPAATQNCLNSLPLFSSTRLYVVTRLPEGGIAEYESPTVLPPSGTGLNVIVNRVNLPPSVGYEWLIVLDGCPRARWVTETCYVTPGDLLVLGAVDLLPIAAPVGVYCFRSACESIGGVVPQLPRFVRCDTGTQHEFTGGESMCIGIGTAPVAVQPLAWGGVKRLYVQDSWPRAHSVREALRFHRPPARGHPSWPNPS